MCIIVYGHASLTQQFSQILLTKGQVSKGSLVMEQGFRIVECEGGSAYLSVETRTTYHRKVREERMVMRGALSAPVCGGAVVQAIDQGNPFLVV